MRFESTRETVIVVTFFLQQSKEGYLYKDKLANHRLTKLCNQVITTCRLQSYKILQMKQAIMPYGF